MVNNEIKVSIVIPTYNCVDKLTKALQSIENLDFYKGAFEVIVVDDGSRDGTKEYVEGLIHNTKLNLTYLYQENSGPSAARNRGIKNAAGEYILIIDSDCFVNKLLINQYLKHFPAEMLAGVGGNIVPDTKNRITDYLDYIGVWRPGYKEGRINYLVTANAFFKKNALEEAGLFDEDFRQPGGEEPELCYRLLRKGYHFKYDTDAVVIHSHRTSVAGMLKTFFVHGKGRGILAKKWPDEWIWKTAAKDVVTDIVLGGNALKKFRSDYLPNRKSFDALIFFVLEYIRLLAYYFGYIYVTGSSDGKKICQK